MKILHITLAAACMLMVACTTIDEEAYRGAGIAAALPRGSNVQLTDFNGAGIYRFKVRKLGGAFTGTNSMGGTYASDDQISFKDAMQAIVATGASIASFKASAATEITKRFQEGELTTRQANQLNNQLANVQTQAELTKFLAGLEHIAQ